VPLLYLVPALRRRLRAGAEAREEQLVGALLERAPAGVRWELAETVRSLAAVYGIEIRGGDWPANARPNVRLRGRRIVADDPTLQIPAELPATLARLQVESWDAYRSGPVGCFRFRPLGATHVASLFPPMRYTRGLNDEEAELTLQIWQMSAELVGLASH
jgi:hypothetical protein